jgi:hypothetical protein
MTATRIWRSDRPVRSALRRRPSLQSVAEATLSWIREESLNEAVREAFAPLLEGPSVRPLDVPTVTVHPAPENARVRVPLRIAIFAGYDAAVDLDLRVAIGALNGAPRAWLYQFDVDVTWTAWQDVTSLRRREAMIRQTLRVGLASELERRIASTLDQCVRRLCPMGDGQRLHAMWLDGQAIRFRCSPATGRTLPITLRVFPEVALGGGDLTERFGT